MYILAEITDDGTIKVIDREVKSIEDATEKLQWSEKYIRKTIVLIPVAASFNVDKTNFGYDIKAEVTKY